MTAKDHALQQIKDYYGLTFLKWGMLVDVNGEKGRISGIGDIGLIAKLIDENKSIHFNPMWGTTYYDEFGFIIKSFKTKKNAFPFTRCKNTYNKINKQRMKEYTYAVVGTNKTTGIRKVIAGRFKTRERAEKRLEIEKNDKYMKTIFRYMKVAKEKYHPRMEGSCGRKIDNKTSEV